MFIFVLLLQIAQSATICKIENSSIKNEMVYLTSNCDVAEIISDHTNVSFSKTRKPFQIKFSVNNYQKGQVFFEDGSQVEIVFRQEVLQDKEQQETDTAQNNSQIFDQENEDAEKQRKEFLIDLLYAILKGFVLLGISKYWCKQQQDQPFEL